MEASRRFDYRFSGPDGLSLELAVVLDGETLTCVEPAPVAKPWTALAAHQCGNCPLDPARVALCPYAARIEPVIRPLENLISHETVVMEADDGNRQVSSRTSAQAAVSSVIGLIGAVSGCPRTAFLRPMAWFHLPLADPEETLFRAAGSYLLGQYFAQDDGRAADWQMDGLKDHYRELRTVNLAMAGRLREAGGQDAAINALVRLDALAMGVLDSIDAFLDRLGPIFRRLGP